LTIVSSKILPLTFFFNHTYCAYAVRGATCEALYRHFPTSEKSSCKLANPRGPLSRLIPSLSIVSANEKVQSVLESKECTQSGRKGQRYTKVSPELKAEIGRWAAEHGVAATVRLYATQQKPNCCFSKQLGYCNRMTILPMLNQIM